MMFGWFTYSISNSDNVRIGNWTGVHMFWLDCKILVAFCGQRREANKQEKYLLNRVHKITTLLFVTEAEQKKNKHSRYEQTKQKQTLVKNKRWIQIENIGKNDEKNPSILHLIDIFACITSSVWQFHSMHVYVSVCICQRTVIKL